MKYRYFVVKPGTCGEHVFAATIAQSRPQRRPLRRRARAGRRQVADDVLSEAARRARYGVLGWPVGHSRSPAMMRAAGLERYQRLPVAPEAFDDTVRALHGAGLSRRERDDPAQGGRARARDERQRCGARDRRGEHADASARAARSPPRTPTRPGLSARSAAARCARRSCSAPAAARARWSGRWRAPGADVSIWNRTPERARRASARASSREPVAADVLVNCTSVGPRPFVQPIQGSAARRRWAGEYTTVVDLVYRAGGTVLIREAAQAGRRHRRRPRDPGSPGRAELHPLDRSGGAAGLDARGRARRGPAGLDAP